MARITHSMLGTGPDPHQDVIREVATCLDLHLHIASGGTDTPKHGGYRYNTL